MPQEGTSIPLQRVTSLRRRAQANEFAARPMVASCIAAAPSEAMSTSPSRRTCKGCRPSGAKPAMHQFLVSCCACCLRASYNARVSLCLFVCVGLSQLTGWCSVERFSYLCFLAWPLVSYPSVTRKQWRSQGRARHAPPPKLGSEENSWLRR